MDMMFKNGLGVSLIKMTGFPYSPPRYEALLIKRHDYTMKTKNKELIDEFKSIRNKVSKDSDFDYYVDDDGVIGNICFSYLYMDEMYKLMNYLSKLENHNENII